MYNSERRFVQVSILAKYRKIKSETDKDELSNSTGVQANLIKRGRSGISKESNDCLDDSKNVMTIYEALGKFGYDSFRDGQEEVINEVIYGELGVLAVFPTGSGKSLVYQIPPLVSGKLTVVVSPLISLMRDQVTKLQSLGINAIFINSTVPLKDVEMAMMEVRAGSIQALYVAPERFDNIEFIGILKTVEVDVFAIDEAHCISRYGQDFRPSYSRLGNVVEQLGPRQVVALTATATVAVQDDICNILGMVSSKRFIRGVFRDNLSFSAIEGLGPNKVKSMCDMVRKFVDGGMTTGIVYSPTRKEAESICEFFNDSGVKCEFYHAGLKDMERSAVQDEWSENGGVIVATCAFGMGIDRPDVRFVIHSGLSQSVEDLWQECGRAGRDGKESFCISYWDMGKDYRTQMFLIDITNPCVADVVGFWSWLNKYVMERVSDGDKFFEVNLTQKVMGEMSRCLNVGACISVLKSKGLVETIGRGKYKVTVGGKLGEVGPSDNLRDDKINKLNNVIKLYKTTGCRARFITEYFGDKSYNKNCNICDNCIRNL